MNENTTNVNATVNLADTLPGLPVLLALDWEGLYTKGNVARLSWLSSDWGFEFLKPADVKKAALISGALIKAEKAEKDLEKCRADIKAEKDKRTEALATLDRAEADGVTLSTVKLAEVNEVLEKTTEALKRLRKAEEAYEKVLDAFRRVQGADNWKALFGAWSASFPAVDRRMMTIYREDTLGVRSDIADDALLEKYLRADYAYLLKAEKAEKEARHHALADLLGFWGGKKCAKLNNTEVAFIGDKMLSTVKVEYAVTGYDFKGGKKTVSSISFALRQNGARAYAHTLALIVGCKCSGVRFTPQNVLAVDNKKKAGK